MDHNPHAAGHLPSDFHQTVLDHLSLGVLVCDANQDDFPIVYANHAAVHMTGYALGEMLGRNPRFLQGADTKRQTVTEIKAALLSQQGGSWELLNYRKDGIPFWNHLTLTPVYDGQGKLTHYLGIQMDITDRKREEAHRRESEEQFRILADSVPVLIWMSGPDARCHYFNKPWLEFTGRSLEQERGEGWLDAVHPDDRSPCQEAYLTAFANRSPFQIEYRLRRHDGAYRWVIDYGVPRYSDDQTFLGYIGSGIDITDRTLAEQALREKDRLLNALFEDSPIGIELFDQDGTSLRKNETLRRILGLPDKQFGIGQYNLLTDPMSKSIGSDKAFQQALAGEVVVRNDLHFNLASKANIWPTDYREMWIDVYYFPLTNQEGDGLGVVIFVRDVTDRVLSQRALRESEERFRTAFQFAGIGMTLYSSEGSFLAVNDAFCGMLGYTEEELLSTNYQSITHPDDLVISLTRNTELLQGNIRSFTLEKRFLHKQGRIIWGHLTCVSVCDDQGRAIHFIAQIQDITERKKAEEALMASERRFRALIENNSDGIIILDAEKKCRYVSPSVSMIWGYSEEELLGTPPTLYIPPEDVQRIRGDLDALRDNPGRVWRFQHWIRHKDGSYRWLSVVATNLLHEPAVGGIVVNIRDITEKKKAEEEQARLEAQMRETQKLESLGVLAGGIAHDFNNMLVTILGYADLAENDLPPISPVRGFLHEIVESSRRAADLCQQMLAYAGKGKFLIAPVSLSQLVQDTIKLLQLSISKKAVLSLDLASNLPAVMADANQMRQVIMNLVLNASDALGEASGTISVTTTLVEAERDHLNTMRLGHDLQPGTYVGLKVTDTGCGMDEATLGRIFEPFFTTKFAGRGLGLAAVLGIVRSHGGALGVESLPGQGTTFQILFSATASTAEVPVVKDNIPLHGSGLILVADDEDSVRRLAVVILQALGFQTVEARDGQEAVDVIQRQGQEIRAALIDLTMPRLDGRQAVVEIRRLAPNFPVIIMSGYTETEISGWFAGDGLVKFLQKPFTKNDLAEKLAEVLQ